MRPKVLVTGGRQYGAWRIVWACLDLLDQLQGIDRVVCGMAKGADTLARQWAESRGVYVAKYPVTKEEWLKYGRAAGPMRNQRMIDTEKPTIVLAFPGKSGTKDCVTRAEKAGIPVFLLDRD